MAAREHALAVPPAERPYEFTMTRREGDDGPEWVAQVVELSGCEGRGGTEEEALASVRRAMSEWIDDAIENGKPVPPPKAEAAHSGRILVRMPPSLHSDLVRMADREKVSLNTLIVGMLSGGSAWRGTTETRNGTPVAAPGPAATSSGRRRALSYALVANIVVLAVAAALAAALLITALTR